MERIDLEYALGEIHAQKNRILYLPRQSGKCSGLKALQDHLKSGAEVDRRRLHVNIEAAQALRQDVSQVIAGLLRL